MKAISFWKKSWFEGYAPVAAGAATLFLCYRYQPLILGRFSPDGWDASNLYGAVFDWASIQSGFVFAIYGFIVAKRDGFIGDIARGVSFPRFVRFTGRACIGGFALTVASLPLLVASPKISASEPMTYWLVAGWFSFFIWAFCAFLRVAFSFGIMVATPDRAEKIPG